MIESKELVSYWDNAWNLKDSIEVNTFAEAVLKIVKNENKKTLLDLGCGNGNDSLFFHQMGLFVTAIDLAQKTIDSLKNEHPEIAWYCQDIKDPIHHISKQDVVYAHLSLHYFEDDVTAKIFRNIAEILNEDGLLFVKSKSTKDPLFGMGNHLGVNRYHYGHTRNFFTVGYMMQNLKHFRIISIRETSHCYHGQESAFIEAIARSKKSS